jgi:cell division protein FtsL
MSFKTYFKIASFVTVIALLYIHMQMKICELSYNGKDKEKIIHELNDSNGALSHQILTLKSANNLGNALLDRDNSLQFMDNERVMTVSTSARVMQRLAVPKAKFENPVWNLFSFLGAQEAKAWEQNN